MSDPHPSSPDNHGQRARIAEFLLANRDRVIRMARHRLSPGTRSVYDSQEVFSSVLRRLDSLASRGGLRMDDECELWGLIATAVKNTSSTKSSIMRRVAAMLHDDPTFSAVMISRISHCQNDSDAQDALLEISASIGNAELRQMFFLRMRGATHAAVAGALGINEDAARQRWSVLVAGLVARFGNKPRA